MTAHLLSATRVMGPVTIVPAPSVAPVRVYTLPSAGF
jgi:hypothetical protein